MKPGPQAPPADTPQDADLRRLEKRAERERLARKEAEQLLQQKSAELFDALQRSRESERHLQLALWASGEGIWSWRAEDDTLSLRQVLDRGRVVEHKARRIERLRRLVHPADRVLVALAWQMATEGHREDVDTACRVRWGAGWRWLRLRGRTVEKTEQGRPVRMVGTVRDITDQRQAEHSLRLMAHAFANTHDALAVLDGQGRVVEGNESLARLMGMGVDELPGLRLPEHLEPPLAEARGQAPWRGESQLRGRHEAVDVDVLTASLQPTAGEARFTVVALQDARERKRSQQELRRQASTDALTGLPNRSALLQRLEEMLRSGEPLGVIFIDLDGFKLVNDSAGHDVGDRLLREVARRLAEAMTPPAFVGRWGGDEFVVVAPGVEAEAALAELGHAVLQRCRKMVPTQDRRLAVGASLGAVLAPRDGHDAATLLRRADAAMYRAKENGRNRLEFFEPQLEQLVRRRAELLTQLRLDADQDAFGFEIQSMVDRSGAVCGGEMLMRWSTPLHGAVPPDEFIPLAEQAGLMQRIGLNALHRAVQAAGRLQAAHRPDLRLAVNVSAEQLREGGLCEQLIELCEGLAVSPGSLDLELTESAYVHDMRTAQPQLEALHSAGFGLSLDDFGTGYSALSQLRDLPFDRVKIDRAFVRDLAHCERARRLLEGVVQLCRGMGMATVAEGVETAEQHRMLHALGVDLFQGWHLARPVGFEAWLTQVEAQPRVATAGG